MKRIGQQLISSVEWPLVAALLLAVAAAVPLLSEPGLLNTRGGGDSPFLLQRLHQLETALRDGHFPVRWMPDANYGQGYPFFNYYAPLSIYIAAAFRFLGFSYVRAIHLAQLSGFLVAAWGMYHLACHWWGSKRSGVLAAAAYTFAPFHLVNIYVRGDSLAEFWAMAFYPLIFLAGDKLVSREQLTVSSGHSIQQTRLLAHSPIRLLTNSLPFSLAYAGLILSHNISALIFTPFLLLYLLFRLWEQSEKSNIPSLTPPPSRLAYQVSRFTLHASHLIIPFALALALSAWFWLPALGEQRLAQLGPVTEGYFHYSNHFRGRDLIQPTFLFNYDISPGADPFRMGLVQAGLVVLAVLALLPWFRRKPHHQMAQGAFPLLLCLIATFMLTPASRLLWDHLPLLPFTQFPWRFLSVQAFAAALAVGVLGQVSEFRFQVSGFRFQVSSLVTLAVCLVLVWSGLGDLRPDHLPVTDGEVTAERLAEYEWFTGNIGSTVSAEYLPHWVRPRPYSSSWLMSGKRDQAVIWGMGSATIQERHTTRQTWQITVPAGQEAVIMLPTLYWPGWQADLADGSPINLHPAVGAGLIQFTVPGGDHTLTIRLTRTPLRLTAEIISGAAAFLSCFLYFWLHPSPTSRIRHHALRITLALLLLLLAAQLPRPTPGLDRSSWDFAQMGYLHQAQEPILFTNGVQLNEYEYATAESMAGKTWQITLNLSLNGVVQPTGTIWLTTPAITRYAAAPPLASLSQQLQDGDNQFTFILPENAPPGLYMPRLMIGDAVALTPSGQPRGDLFLRPFRLHNTAIPPSPNEALGVQVMAVRPRTLPDNQLVLDVQMAWYTATPLSQNLTLSLLLTRPNGEWLQQFDSQPGYGFLPTTGWPPNRWINDWISLPLPNAVPPYTLIARLYEANGDVILTRRLGMVDWFEETYQFTPNQPSYTLPPNLEPTEVRLGDAAALRSYTLTQTPTALDITLYWQALTPGSTDYRHFIHLINPESGEIVTQHDAMPVNNSYPTSQWTQGEIIADAAALSLIGIPPGQYHLFTGLYHPAADGTFPRLPAQNPDGSFWPDGAVFITSIIIP
ncbi:MAG: hypothetical protein KJ063_19210 [Anaerolineae bacterium]|nr:hypothetical protein [Anaerolineae bacterium]